VSLGIVVGVAGCADGAGSDPASAATGKLRVLVADMVLRSPGSECSGAIPFAYVHKGSVISFDDMSESEPITMVLPAGRAIRGDSLDWGTAPRVPTNCEFIIDAGALEQGVRYGVEVAGNAVEHYYTYPANEFQGLATVIIPSSAVVSDVASAAQTPSDTATTPQED
jgi:hypothetical protein